MKKYHYVKILNITKDKLQLLVDEKLYEFSLAKVSRKLENARDEERKNIIISPSGYGIHWPLIDEDISIDGLIKMAIKRKNKQIV